MVHYFILIAALFVTTAASASQLDESLGPPDPPYFQAVSGRFLSWSRREYIPQPSPQETRALRIVESQIPNLRSWSFPLSENFLWPRLQFGLRFKNKRRASVHFSIFPDDPSSLAAEVAKAYPGLSKSLLKGLAGFGFETSPFQVFIYQKEDLPPDFPLGKTRTLSASTLKRSLLSPSAGAKPLRLVRMKPPLEASFAFAPIVENWAAWFTEEGRLDSYQLEFRRFNIRILDDSAIFDAKKISSEFLMANLRLGYISNDDYQIQYP